MNTDMLTDEIDRLNDIIRRAKIEFFKEGSDTKICHQMLMVLMEAERKDTK